MGQYGLAVNRLSDGTMVASAALRVRGPRANLLSRLASGLT